MPWKKSLFSLMQKMSTTTTLPSCSEGGEVAPEADVPGDPDPFSSSTFPDIVSAPVHSTPAAPSLTEEQRQRMELNRQRALERKLARQQQEQQQQEGERRIDIKGLRKKKEVIPIAHG